jgi:acyl-CoA synthetase (AMP-forming)/AMP-acid ligase II
MLVSLLVPIVAGQDIHLLDAWQPAKVIELMRAHQVSAGTGAPVFLQSLLDAEGAGPDIHDLVGYAQLGGAPVPPSLVRRADSLGIVVTRGYGCTEHPSVALGTAAMTLEARATTDGLPPVGVDVKVVDDTGADLAAGTPGELLTRGPDLSSGYTDEALTAAAFTVDGWFRTGDIATINAAGAVSIVDRKKDIIIRSGMNISAAEVESALLEIDGIDDVAVVGLPDVRTQERVVALYRGPRTVSLEDIRAHMERRGSARFKWPVEVRHWSGDFPRTPAGKVRKIDLRASLT